MKRKNDPVLDELHRIREGMYRQNRQRSLEETAKAIVQAARKLARRYGKPLKATHQIGKKS